MTHCVLVDYARDGVELINYVDKYRRVSICRRQVNRIVLMWWVSAPGTPVRVWFHFMRSREVGMLQGMWS